MFAFRVPKKVRGREGTCLHCGNVLPRGNTRAHVCLCV